MWYLIDTLNEKIFKVHAPLLVDKTHFGTFVFFTNIPETNF